MRHPKPVLLLCALMLAISVGCNSAPGRPALESRSAPAGPSLELRSPLSAKLRGMSRFGGQGGAAVSLSSGVYLAIAGDDTIRRVTAEGVPGTVMPAFAQSSGGMLTDEQINAIVSGIRSRWGKADIFGHCTAILRRTDSGRLTARSRGLPHLLLLVSWRWRTRWSAGGIHR